MIARSAKLDAISKFGLMVGRDPWFSLLIGYLMGQIDRVNFVDDLKDADIAIKMSARSSAIWPHEPFRAAVRGIGMPNTFTLIRSICNEETPICVSLDFDHAEDSEWYQGVLLPNVSYVKGAEEAAQAESEALWKDMDRTLDIYREAKAMMKDDSARQKELAYYMSIAEEQMKALSRQMEEINKQMKRIADRETEEQN